jgi:type IV pilus assembly protein PilO
MTENLKEALKQLPNDREIPGLLSEIDEQGRKAGLEVRKFQPLPEVMHEYYAEVPVSIVMDGSYHEVGSFFDAVRQMDRIVSVADINLSNPQDNGGETRLTVSGKAVTYRFLTDAEIEAKKKSAAGKKGKKKGGGGE